MKQAGKIMTPLFVLSLLPETEPFESGDGSAASPSILAQLRISGEER